jgi:hypothetical protein
MTEPRATFMKVSQEKGSLETDGSTMSLTATSTATRSSEQLFTTSEFLWLQLIAFVFT